MSVKYSGIFRHDFALMQLLYHGMLANKLQFTREEVDVFFKRVRDDLKFNAHVRTIDTGIRHEVIDECTQDEKVVKYAHVVPYKKALSIASMCGFFVDLDEFIKHECMVWTGELLDEYELSLFKLLSMPVNGCAKSAYTGPLADDATYNIKTNKKKIIEHMAAEEISSQIIKSYVDPFNKDPRIMRNAKILEMEGVYMFESDKIENGTEIFANTFYRTQKQAKEYVNKLKKEERKAKLAVKPDKKIIREPITQISFFDFIDEKAIAKT